MTTILLIVVLLLGGALAITYFLKRRVEGTVEAARQEAVSAQQQRDAAIANAQAAYEQKVAELGAEAERIRAQYEAEARKIADEANSRVAELEPLRGYAALKDAETEVQKILADAVA